MLQCYMQKLNRAFGNPWGFVRLIAQKLKELLLWDHIFNSLPDPKMKKWYNVTSEIKKEITKDLKKKISK